jgi:hypothetical protein
MGQQNGTAQALFLQGPVFVPKPTVCETWKLHVFLMSLKLGPVIPKALQPAHLIYIYVSFLLYNISRYFALFLHCYGHYSTVM